MRCVCVLRAPARVHTCVGRGMLAQTHVYLLVHDIGTHEAVSAVQRCVLTVLTY